MNDNNKTTTTTTTKTTTTTITTTTTTTTSTTTTKRRQQQQQNDLINGVRAGWSHSRARSRLPYDSFRASSLGHRSASPPPEHAQCNRYLKIVTSLASISLCPLKVRKGRS